MAYGLTVRAVITFLEMYFPGNTSFETALLALWTLLGILPLLSFHRNQLREPRQPYNTAWMRSLADIVAEPLLSMADFVGHGWIDLEEVNECADSLVRDAETLFDLLNPEMDQELATRLGNLNAKPILCTTYRNCVLCTSTPGNTDLATLRRRDKLVEVALLDQDLKWCQATLVVGHCRTCGADYFPDKIVFSSDNPNGLRQQKLIYDAQFLRISKHGIWVHRRIAFLQEQAVIHFHSGWSNFAGWLSNNIKSSGRPITYRQSKRLYIEHFSRRLLLFHRLSESAILPSNTNSDTFAAHVRDLVGKDGGVIPSAMDHGCSDCTHAKRYSADLVEEGLLAADCETDAVAGAEDLEDFGIAQAPQAPEPTLNADIPASFLNGPPAVQNIQQPDEPRGYVRLAVMDGKSIGHRICAINDCKAPLVNFRNGRFCKDHIMHWQNICGIIPCGRPVHAPGALTCDTPSHQTWYKAYIERFKRLTFPGVQRVMRKQKELPNQMHNFQVTLPSLDGNPAETITHTFRAQSVYCIQTVQWSCGTPIGWGKCYKSESLPQVLSILDRIWEPYPSKRPGFLAYDNACDLLRHIITQNAQSPWLTSTRFIVDTWHYIGHRATDILCRLWCNPAPHNGSQPDLIHVVEDRNGDQHIARAFNLETAEQLNAWLNGYEAQLRQMTDVMFDFHLHALLMLYTESTADSIKKKEKELDDDFWEKVAEVRDLA
ncbi:hypothetical protein FB446DRAFT_767253 [Lentinula raphanica]|nr:hypothetical protein FB446DRAFT_767253 [Lentinula raphanica]